MNKLTLMFCGPHRVGDRWSPFTHRLRAAVAHCRRVPSQLVILGDIHEGRDLSFFSGLARDDGLESIALYNNGGRTLTDVRTVMVYLRDRPEVGHLDIVTDWWHLTRTLAYFDGEFPRFHPGRRVEITPVPTFDGPEPGFQVMVNEANGIVDYRRDPDGYLPRGGPFGKPSHGLPEATVMEVR
jgi:hypothetical protein